jgi:hypothetical protein
MTKAFKVSIAAPSFVKSGGSSNQYLMADGSVTTGGSTTSMNYAQTQATKQSNISTSGVTIVSTSITTGGNPVQVLVTGDAENTVAGGWIRLQLFRGTTAIGKGINVESSAASENIPYALTVIDTPTAGTYTYSLQTITAAATGAFNFGEVDGPVLTAIELNTLTPTTNLSLTGTVSADQVAATNNGNGTNFKVGDDAWIGDINTSNTLSIRGQQSSSLGYIRLGSDTNSFGYNGTNLVYGTTIIPSSGGTLATTGQTFFIGTQSIAINQGTGTITSLPGVSSINGATIPSSGTLAINPTTTIGDVIYASATGTPGTLARLAGNTATQTSFLASTGNGTANTTTSFISSTGTAGSNVVLATSPTITTPTIASISGNTTINNASGTDTINLYANVLTGAVYLANNITSGVLQFASGTGFNGTINIATGAGTVNKTINIGTSSTAGTTSITLGSLAGATSNINLNGSVTLGSLPTAGFVKTSATGFLSVDTSTYLTPTTGVTTVNGSSGTISNIAVTNANNNFLTSQTVTGTVTATNIVKSGGTSSQYLMADGSVSTGSSLPDIVPLDNLQFKFDGVESRFLPTYQGVTQVITNPFRLLLSVNGIIQSISLPEYVWGTPFTMDGFMVDSDGYIAFSEVPPAGSTFFGTIQAGPTTQSSNNTYPFRAMDILLGAY